MFKLCLALGIPHPDVLPLNMSQLLDWVEYDRQEPFGEIRADLRQEVLVWAALAPHQKRPPRAPASVYPYWPHQVDYEALYEEISNGQ